MQYTTHYNLNLPEGTDVVNPLVQDNPNYAAIDAAMFANKQAVIGTASEVASGTAHAITRANTDSNYFRFTATSNWTAGDTMTVDGTTVSVFLSDGTTPPTGAYVINTEVLAMISGTRVTILTSAGRTTAAQCLMNDGVTSVQDAITDIQSNLIVTEKIPTSTDTASANGGRLGLTATASKPGYTPIGIVGVAFSDTGIALNIFDLTGSTITISGRNFTNASIEAYANVNVLFMKN